MSRQSQESEGYSELVPVEPPPIVVMSHRIQNPSFSRCTFHVHLVSINVLLRVFVYRLNQNQVHAHGAHTLAQELGHAAKLRWLEYVAKGLRTDASMSGDGVQVGDEDSEGMLYSTDEGTVSSVYQCSRALLATYAPTCMPTGLRTTKLATKELLPLQSICKPCLCWNIFGEAFCFV